MGCILWVHVNKTFRNFSQTVLFLKWKKLIEEKRTVSIIFYVGSKILCWTLMFCPVLLDNSFIFQKLRSNWMVQELFLVRRPGSWRTSSRWRFCRWAYLFKRNCALLLVFEIQLPNALHYYLFWICHLQQLSQQSSPEQNRHLQVNIDITFAWSEVDKAAALDNGVVM